jgi:hypothetical protein
VGAFGIRGPGLEIEDRKMLPADQPYRFAPRRVYNLDANQFIRQGEGSFGAHSDLGHVEVAHAVWHAAVPLRRSCGQRQRPELRPSGGGTA